MIWHEHFKKWLGSDRKGDENLTIKADINLDLNETHNILTAAFTLGEYRKVIITISTRNTSLMDIKQHEATI